MLCDLGCATALSGPQMWCFVKGGHSASPLLGLPEDNVRWGCGVHWLCALGLVNTRRRFSGTGKGQQGWPRMAEVLPVLPRDARHSWVSSIHFLQLFPTSPLSPWKPNPGEGHPFPAHPSLPPQMEAAGILAPFPEAAAASLGRTHIPLTTTTTHFAPLGSHILFFSQILSSEFYGLASWGFLYPNPVLTCS